MGEKLRMNTAHAADAHEGEEDEHEDAPKSMNQGQALALITRSFVAIAASFDTLTYIAEKWALKEKILDPKDMEE